MVVQNDDPRRRFGDGRPENVPGCISELLRRPRVTSTCRSTWLWLSSAGRWNFRPGDREARLEQPRDDLLPAALSALIDTRRPGLPGD